MTLAEMRARLEAIRSELRTINTEAGDADLNPEQQTRWEQLEAEAADLGPSIEREERAERVRQSRKKFGAPQITPTHDDSTDVRRLNRPQLRSRAMRVLDDPDSVAHFETDEQRSQTQARVEKMIRTKSQNFDGDAFARYVIATESDAYRSAFMKICARGNMAVLTGEEGEALNLVNELRAAMSLSDANGGYGVPVLIDPTIIVTAQGHPNDFFSIARVENITTDEWKGVTTAGATSYWTSEATTVTGGEPTLAQPSVPTKKLTTYAKYSFEIGGDYPNFASEMSRVLGESESEKIVEGLTNGLGTTAQPTGVVTKLKATAASQVAVTTDGAYGAVDVYKMWDALPIRYRGNARWMGATSVFNATRQFAAGAGGGDANFVANLGRDENVPTLFNKPAHYNDYMDDVFGTGGVTSASDVGLLIVGDWRNFLIANRVGSTVETVQHVIDTTTGNPTGQRGLLMWRRLGSDVINTNGFRLLTND